MSYSDQKFYARPYVNVKSGTWGTATASSATGHNFAAVVELPKFIKRTAINAIRLKVTTIPNAASTNFIAHALNGTNTFGTCVLTTLALNASADFTLVNVASNFNTFTAGGQPTITLVGTATASAAAAGVYDTFFEQQELYV